MSSKKKTPVAKPVDQLQILKDKFIALKALRAQLAALKPLYHQHDELVEELLPLFIKMEADKITIAREISLGTEKFKLTPYFYDEKKGVLKAKVWKGTAHETFAIE